MTAQFPQYPHGVPSPAGWPGDPQAGGVPTAPSHVIPGTPRRSNPLTVAVTAALVASLAALTIVGLFVAHSGSLSDISNLKRQVHTLTVQVGALTHQHEQDTRTIGNLNDQVSTLGKKVDGVAPTVHFVGGFTHTCTSPEQGSGGPYTASFPCKTG